MAAVVVEAIDHAAVSHDPPETVGVESLPASVVDHGVARLQRDEPHYLVDRLPLRAERRIVYERVLVEVQVHHQLLGVHAFVSRQLVLRHQIRLQPVEVLAREIVPVRLLEMAVEPSRRGILGDLADKPAKGNGLAVGQLVRIERRGLGGQRGAGGAARRGVRLAEERVEVGGYVLPGGGQLRVHEIACRRQRLARSYFYRLGEGRACGGRQCGKKLLHFDSFRLRISSTFRWLAMKSATEIVSPCGWKMKLPPKFAAR